MKVKYKDDPVSVRFEKISQGDVFRLRGRVYMRTSQKVYDESQDMRNAITLDDNSAYAAGEIVYISPSTEVIPLNATLLVE
jgi:hypothetical protein